MAKVKVWEKDGELFHDECFTKEESRELYDPVDLNSIDADALCEACDGPIFGEADEVDDDDEPESDQTA